MTTSGVRPATLELSPAEDTGCCMDTADFMMHIDSVRCATSLWSCCVHGSAWATGT